MSRKVETGAGRQCSVCARGLGPYHEGHPLLEQIEGAVGAQLQPPSFARQVADKLKGYSAERFAALLEEVRTDPNAVKKI